MCTSDTVLTKLIILLYPAFRVLINFVIAGSEFDVREFNHQVLRVGRVPLTVLQNAIMNWIR